VIFPAFKAYFCILLGVARNCDTLQSIDLSACPILKMLRYTVGESTILQPN
jgi:hypothetical protein